MIKAIVVEDEWYNLEEIAELIEKDNLIRVEKKYSNPLKVVEEISAIFPQVAFIDIDMPEMDGITLAEKLIEHNPKIAIVFITAYNEYAVKAFDINALDYIMKPINVKRFNNMLEKIRSRFNIVTDEKNNKIRIKCFDGLEVSIGGMPVKWERSKAEELFAFLLMHHGNYMHKEVIIEYLWPEHEMQKALQILQTTVYKIRKIFADSKEHISIDYSNSKYCMAVKNVECDYLKVKQAITNYRSEDKDTYIEIENAISSYMGEFLVKQSYLWSIEKNEELKKRIIYILSEIYQVYAAEKNYEGLAKVLNILCKILPFQEKINYTLLVTMKKLEKYNEIATHYKWLEKVLREEYGTTPSKRIVELFAEGNKKKW